MSYDNSSSCSENEIEKNEEKYVSLYSHYSNSFDAFEQFYNEDYEGENTNRSSVKADIENLIEEQKSFLAQLNLTSFARTERHFSESESVISSQKSDEDSSTDDMTVGQTQKNQETMTGNNPTTNEHDLKAALTEDPKTMIEAERVVPASRTGGTQDFSIVCDSQENNWEDQLVSSRKIEINQSPIKKVLHEKSHLLVDNETALSLKLETRKVENELNSETIFELIQFFEASSKRNEAVEESAEFDEEQMDAYVRNREMKLLRYLNEMNRPMEITSRHRFYALMKNYKKYMDDRCNSTFQDILNLKINEIVTRNKKVWDKINKVFYVSSFIDRTNSYAVEKNVLALIVANEDSAGEHFQKLKNSLALKVNKYLKVTQFSLYWIFKKSERFIVERIREIRNSENDDSELICHYETVRKDIRQMIEYHVRFESLVSIDVDLDQRRRNLEADDFFRDINV